MSKRTPEEEFITNHSRRGESRTLHDRNLTSAVVLAFLLEKFNYKTNSIIEEKNQPWIRKIVSIRAVMACFYI